MIIPLDQHLSQVFCGCPGTFSHLSADVVSSNEMKCDFMLYRVCTAGQNIQS